MGIGNKEKSGTEGSKKKDKNGLGISGQMPVNIVEGMTVEKLSLEFKNLQEKWDDSTVARQIERILKEKEMNGKVNQAVCIGIGSFSRDWTHRWRSMWQLVLFHFVIQHLDIKLAFAQDPAFTTLDIEFLASLDVTALESGIEDKISTEAFVYSPFVDWFLLLPTFLAGKDPVLYIGNEILGDYTSYAGTEEKRARLGGCNVVGDKFLEKRDGEKVREFEGHAHAINGMVVYTRTTSLDSTVDIRGTTTNTTTTTTTSDDAPS